VNITGSPLRWDICVHSTWNNRNRRHGGWPAKTWLNGFHGHFLQVIVGTHASTLRTADNDSDTARRS